MSEEITLVVVDEIAGVPLGMMDGTAYDELAFRPDPGDTLILASDGAADAVNMPGELYDGKRFRDSVCRHSAKEISEFLRCIYSDVREFIGSAELSDDVTIIALRRSQ